MSGINNYTRGNVFRDKKSLSFLFKDFFEKEPNFVGSEAFLVAVMKSEMSEGQILSDLVYFGCTDKYLVILGGTQIIAKVPFSALKIFFWKEFEDSRYYFPPAIPPKRAGIFEVEWENTDGNSRNLLVMFPAPALFPFELEYPSQIVHKKLVSANKSLKYFSSKATETHEWILQYLPTIGIPNEVNDEPCEPDEYLGLD
jgi:hypothetical protein